MRALVRPRRPVQHTLPLLRILTNYEDGLELFRWDSLFIAPASKTSTSVCQSVSTLLGSIKPIAIHLEDPGDTLVIDNWRMVHGRSQVSASGERRRIEPCLFWRNALIPQQVPHEWSAASLLNKAQLYAETMLSFPHDDWRFTLWSTLSLELLARAALANVSPTLLADSKASWNNLLFSLGTQPNATNFSPRSIDIREVFVRLQVLVQDFTRELKDIV